MHSNLNHKTESNIQVKKRAMNFNKISKQSTKKKKIGLHFCYFSNIYSGWSQFYDKQKNKYEDKDLLKKDLQKHLKKRLTKKSNQKSLLYQLAQFKYNNDIE